MQGAKYWAYAVFAALVLYSGGIAAQSYPTKPIRMIDPVSIPRTPNLRGTKPAFELHGRLITQRRVQPF